MNDREGTIMSIKNASPGLYNEDLAPAKERNWGAFSIFNVWTSDVHSLWGYYLAASLFLLCGSFTNFLLAIGLGSLESLAAGALRAGAQGRIAALLRSGNRRCDWYGALFLAERGELAPEPGRRTERVVGSGEPEERDDRRRRTRRGICGARRTGRLQP